MLCAPHTKNVSVRSRFVLTAAPSARGVKYKSLILYIERGLLIEGQRDCPRSQGDRKHADM